MTTSSLNTNTKPSSGLNLSLWAVQALLSFTFVGTAVWKMFTPLSELAQMIPWVGQVPSAFLYFIILVDLSGGLGIVLPTLTRIKPALTWWAALGCAALQMSAIVFHIARGEASNTPFNFLLVVLSIFVYWGRRFKTPLV
jgi:hypothetical protein